MLDLAIHGLRLAGLSQMVIDLGDARILPALLEDQDLSPEHHSALLSALVAKDAAALAALSGHLSVSVQHALTFLIGAYGDRSVLDRAESALSAWPQALQAISDLRALSAQLQETVMFDLADARGYAYYSGIRFAIYVPKLHEALLRGGRYDEVGAVFGRRRAAVGFSLDLKALVACVPASAHHAAIRAPWSPDAGLRSVIARLRERGETVICALPGHESETLEFMCDRELTCEAGQWIVRPL